MPKKTLQEFDEYGERVTGQRPETSKRAEASRPEGVSDRPKAGSERPAFGRERANEQDEDGDGLFSDLVNKILPTRKDFPPKVRDIIQKYQNSYIKGILICRTPVQGYIKNFLNSFSSGKFEEQIKKLGYDDVYHLFMNVALEGGTDILIEKNQVVNMVVNANRNADATMVVPLNGEMITFGQFINNTVKAVGPSIYLYDHINNNCQVFIKNLLEANGLLTPTEEDFIMQDVQQIMEDSPEVLNTIARFSTEAAAKFDRFLHGRGFRQGQLGHGMTRFQNLTQCKKVINDPNSTLKQRMDALYLRGR